MKDVAIIGAGICGAAVAYYLAEYSLDVCVIERCDESQRYDKGEQRDYTRGLRPESELYGEKQRARKYSCGGNLREAWR